MLLLELFQSAMFFALDAILSSLLWLPWHFYGIGKLFFRQIGYQVVVCQKR